MSWECRTVEEQRKAFVLAAKSGSNFSAVCREFGITRKTGYKWLARYEEGLELTDLDKTPHVIPRKTHEDVERQILDYRDRYNWGARTIHQVLKNSNCPNLPCVKTVNNILKRNERIMPEESAKRIPYVRFVKEHCNDMWQTDFKGEFLMKDGHYCFPLDIIDDSSRFLLKIVPVESTANIVIPTFKQAFLEYGMPKSVLSDNGGQFAGFKHGYTRYEKWLMDLDILPIHGRAWHPQTQGKIERFHRSLNHELLKLRTFEDIDDTDRALQEWREVYNTVRPHEALNMMCPADVYEKSSRPYPDSIRKYEYSGEHKVIRVNNWGYVRFAGYQVYLSETMIGEYIEFRHSADGNTLDAYYRNFRIAQFDVTDGKRINRSIYRE